VQLEKAQAETKKGTSAPVNGAPAATAQRSHAERNKEFFFISTLAVKMNIEARYKRERKRVPAMSES